MGAYDVLTGCTGQGRVTKRIHIYNCDYLIRQIEYFDNVGDVLAVVKLGEYEQIAEGCFRAEENRDQQTYRQQSGDSIKISLSSVGLVKLNDKVRQRIFVPPSRRDLGIFTE